MTMNAMMTMSITKKTRKLCQDNSIHARSSRRDAYDSAQRDWNLPILYQMAITDSYERGDDDDKKEGKVIQRKLCKVHSTNACSYRRKGR